MDDKEKSPQQENELVRSTVDNTVKAVEKSW